MYKNNKSSILEQRNILHLTGNTAKLRGYNTLAVNATFACRKAVTIDASSNLQYSLWAEKERTDFASLGIVRENGITPISYYERVIRIFCRNKEELLRNVLRFNRKFDKL